MDRPSLKRTVTAVALSLLVASVILVGTAPVSAQSKSNGQGIPQQIAALEQQVAALGEQVTTLSNQMNVLSLPTSLTAGQLAAFERRLAALEERLAGQTSGSGQVLRVVDANGVEVGPMILPSSVVRKAGEFWLQLNVGTNGFMQDQVTLAADNSTCDGKRYMLDFGGLLKLAPVANGVAYYASGTPQPVAVAAWYHVFAGGGSSCEAVTGDPTIIPGLSEVATVDLNGFFPPFTVRYDQ